MAVIDSFEVGGTTYDLNAAALETPATIDGISFDGNESVTRYAACATAGATAAKVVTLGTDLTLAPGAAVVVKFNNANTAENPTLNVNGTGAYPIMAYGSTAAGSGAWAAGETVVFGFDGANWQQIGGAVGTTSIYGRVMLDTTFSKPGTAAESVAVKNAISGALIHRGSTSETDDIDDTTFAHGGQWYVPTTGHPQNFPFSTGAGRIVVFGPDTDAVAGKMQLVFSYGGKAAWRFGYGTTVDGQYIQTWSRWRTLADEDDLTEVDSNFFKANRAAMADNSLASDLTSPGSYSKAAAVTVTDLPTQKSGYIYNPNKASSDYQYYHNVYGEFWYRNGYGWHLASPGNSYGYSLAGKVLAGVGSSFMRQYNSSAFVPIGKQWFSLIGDKFAMTYYNNGLAGSAIARKTGETAASIAARIDTILTEHTNTDEDASNGTLYPGSTVDYFIILGGGNDSSNSIPLGDIDSQDDTTFHGALNVITDKIRAKYPRAKLLYITCFRRWLADTTHTQTGHNTLGLVDQDYANAMVESAKYNSVNVFDAWHESGLMPKYGDSSQADSIYAWPWISRENKHLNEDGNAYIAPIIAKRLNLL